MEPGKGRRPGLGRPDDDVGLHRAAAGHHRGAVDRRTAGGGAAGGGAVGGRPRPDVEHLGVLEELHAPALDRVRQPPGEEGRLQRRAMWREGRAQNPGSTDQLVGLFGTEPAQVVLAHAQRARLVHLGQRSQPLRLAAHEVHRATLGELAVDALARRAGADDVDGLLERPAHRPHGVEPVSAGQRRVRRREQRRAPAAVASRRPEARHLTLDDRDAQCRVGQRQRVGRPEAREAGADDADVDLEILGEGRTRRQRDRHRLPPQREPLVPRGGPPGYILRHASESTSRSVEAMKSNSSWPQISGGESCTTGSPRSSARQINPASNNAPDR